jgi:predicted transcriptional regulator YheO
MIQISSDLWMKNKPDNAVGMETCINLNLSPSKLEAGLDDVTCLAPFKPMCQIVT